MFRPCSVCVLFMFRLQFYLHSLCVPAMFRSYSVGGVPAMFCLSSVYGSVNDPSDENDLFHISSDNVDGRTI